jgi:hypothetical protein
MHHHLVHIYHVGKHRSSRHKSPLVAGDRFCQWLFDANADRVGHQAVVAIDDVEGPRVRWPVARVAPHRCTASFGEEYHDALIEGEHEVLEILLRTIRH